MKGCFYLFAMPSPWAPYFCFRHAYTAGELGVVGLPESTPLWLGATTVPMGFCNAMGIIQYAHRRVHIGPQAGSLPSLPLSREIRKDHAVPPLKAHAPALQEAWSVYCDDADVPRVTVPTGDTSPGRKSPLQDMARARFEHHALLMSDKCWTAESQVKRLGACIDGALGVM